MARRNIANLYSINLTLQKIFFELILIPALLAQSEASLSEEGCGEARVGQRRKRAGDEKDWFQLIESSVKMEPS